MHCYVAVIQPPYLVDSLPCCPRHLMHSVAPTPRSSRRSNVESFGAALTHAVAAAVNAAALHIAEVPPSATLALGGRSGGCRGLGAWTVDQLLLIEKGTQKYPSLLSRRGEEICRETSTVTQY